MDRRALVVGGGAAALAAVVGANQTPAAASTLGEPPSTAEHARRVLDLVNVDLGLVDPIGIQSRVQAGIASYYTSPPRDASADDLHAWVQRRLASLTGSGSFDDAVNTDPRTRTLLAFAVLASSQRRDAPQPALARSMPIPAVLASLEPDFFPVLLDQICAKRDSTPPFARSLQASSAELDRLIVIASNNPAFPASASFDGWVYIPFVVTLLVCAIDEHKRRRR